ncbi:MAG: hypothetical protein H0U67_05395 [Gemmatimonadetes bacterium]|nr:hypothetical protein [Gemmatimonadota bacterium]
MGGMLNGGTTLVTQMIGAALRGTALQGLDEYFLTCRDNPEALRGLADLLAELRSAGQHSLDVLALRRGEPAFADQIVPNMELMVPSLERAIYNSQAKWADYDLLRLATAVELYRHDVGHYPVSLEELSPRYIRRLPVDPMAGLPYDYANVDSDGYS